MKYKLFMKKIIICLALIFTVYALVTKAALGEEYDVGEIVVSAEREGLQKGSEDSTGFVTVIRPDDLPSQVVSIPEVLDQSAGITVKQYGGLGSFSTVSIRGSSSDQVVVYLDGILLNSANSGSVNLADIPLDNVEKIEVYRGTSPAKFAASGIGGVVNIITKKARQSVSANLNYSFGSFSTHKASASFARRLDKLNYALFFNRTQSKGNFEYKDNKGTEYNRDDDEWVHRKNNRFHSENFLIKGGYDFLNGYKVDASFNFFNKKQGIPGIANFQSRDAGLETLRSLSQVKLSKQGLFISDLDAELFLSHSYQRQKFKDLKGEIGLGQQNNREETENIKARMLFTWFPGKSQIVTFLCEGSEEIFQSRDSFASLGDEDSTIRVGYLYGFTEKAKKQKNIKNRSDEQKRYAYALGLEDEIYFFNERLLLSPSIKYNYYYDDFGGKVPFSSMAISNSQNSSEFHVTRKIGAVVKVCRWLELKGNAGKYFRMPKLYELFGDRGGVVGNTDLKPEESFNWDAGFSIRLDAPFKWIKSSTFEYSYFNNEVDDLILFMQNSQRTSVARNISKAEIEGHEFFWRILFFWPIIISGNYTIQDTKDKSDIAYWKGNQLPGRPEFELFNRVEVFSEHFRLFHEFEYMDESYLDRANVRKINDRFFHHAGVSFSPKKELTITFEVKNILDENEEDVIGYPLPGRAFYGTIDVKF